MRLRMGLCAAAILLSASGCSKSTPTDTAPINEPVAAPPAAASPPDRRGSVSGATSPNAIVALEPKTPREWPAEQQPSMDQVSATFTPDLLFVRTGQPVEFRNSDDTLHNVHVGNVDTKEPSFNVAIPTGEKYAYTFQRDGFYHVGCDIHPSMSAEIFASATPFVARAGSDGSFAFSDVPAGDYVVRIFAGLEKSQRDVAIRAGSNSVAVP